MNKKQIRMSDTNLYYRLTGNESTAKKLKKSKLFRNWKYADGKLNKSENGFIFKKQQNNSSFFILLNYF